LKKICIVTGTRAEYGLFYPLLKELRKKRDFKLQIVATGMHLSPEFGLTYKEIEKDGFEIAEKVEMLLSSDSAIGIAKSIGLGIVGIGEALQRLEPDIVLLLGDRFETLAAAIAVTMLGKPIAHFYGGELTEGALDDSFRHAITKMANIHFTATDIYRKRVVQLGEEPERVFNVGALGIDNVRSINLLSKGQLQKKLEFQFYSRNLLVTFHPVTRKNDPRARDFRELLVALDDFSDTGIIFTMPNADPYGRVIIDLIKEYVGKHPGNTAAFTSLGKRLYLSTLKHVDAVVGNSSSGIIEAPALRIPTVNIGERQDGRVRPHSVLDCAPRRRDIRMTLEKACSKEFRKTIVGMQTPYGEGHAARTAVQILGSLDVERLMPRKRFYDIDFSMSP
jgi:UDP-hydrolysing UDP-N-acetyl-D-glucosamine 2-epimerase